MEENNVRTQHTTNAARSIPRSETPTYVHTAHFHGQHNEREPARVLSIRSKARVADDSNDTTETVE